MIRTKGFHVLFLFLALVSAPIALLAQDKETGGQIEDAQFIIEKEREIVLPRRDKFYVQPDIGRFRLEAEEELSYSFSDIEVPIERSSPLFPYQDYDDSKETLSKIYPFGLRLGAGNYLHSYAEAWASTKRAENYYLGGRFKHSAYSNGPVDGTSSGQSYNGLDIDGAYDFEGVRLFGGLNYDYAQFHFYGYPDDDVLPDDSLPVTYQEISGQIGLESTDPESTIAYDAVFEPYFVTTTQEMQETGFNLQASTQYAIGQEDEVDLAFDGLFLTTSYPNSQISRNMLGITPVYRHQMEDLELEAGLSAYFENDTHFNAKPLHLYPILRGKYRLKENMALFAGIDGELQRFSLRQAYQRNPWLDTSAQFYHTNRAFRARAGIEAGLAKHLNMELSLAYSSIMNRPFFNNTPGDISKFQVLYDSSAVGLFNPRLGLNYGQVGKYLFYANASYFSYGLDRFEVALHQPEIIVEAGGQYWLEDKFMLQGAITYWGGLQTLNPINNEIVNLGAIFDIDIKAEYYFGKHFGVFVDMDNLAFQQMTRYYRYPSRQGRIRLGISTVF